MRSIEQIRKLFSELQSRTADELEDQDLDFKQWGSSSTEQAISLVIKMAVCMANGGGGTVVCGIADKVIGPEGLRCTNPRAKQLRP